MAHRFTRGSVGIGRSNAEPAITSPVTASNDTSIMLAARPSAAKLVRPKAWLADGSLLADEGGVRSARRITTTTVSLPSRSNDVGSNVHSRRTPAPA